VKAAGILVMVCLLNVPAFAQESGTVAGRVVADSAALPIARAHVLIANSTRETLTDTEGRFSLSQVAPGERTVIVGRDGYAPLSQSVAVTAGQTTTLNIRLPLAPTLTQEVLVTGRLSDYVDSSARMCSTPSTPPARSSLPAPATCPVSRARRRWP
jgi:hypothetical protein